MLPTVFPLIGRTRVRDTYNAPRGGGTRVHQGVDLPLLDRSVRRDAVYPVRSPVAGTVLRVSREGPTGHPNEGNAYFIRDADGWVHLLAHLLEPPPAAMLRQEVRAGQLLGIASNSGNARNTGPHLHYHIVDDHGRRVNPTQRLALLHAAMEEQAHANRMERRPDAPMPPVPSHRMQVNGVGDASVHSAVNALWALDRHARGVGDEAEEALLDQMSQDAAPPRTTRLQPASGPAAPAPPPRQATEAAIEQARIAVRAGRGLVEREAREALSPSAWDILAAAMSPEQFAMARTTANTMRPIIVSHLASSRMYAEQAEAGQRGKWVAAFEQLLAAHTLVGTVATSFDVARTSSVALRPVLEAVRFADEWANGALETGEGLRAAVQEGYDDLVEAAPTIGAGFLVLGAFGLWLWSQRSQRGR